MAHDIVFADALVVDGTGAPGFRASVGVTDGRIAEITDRAPAANRVVDPCSKRKFSDWWNTTAGERTA